VPVQRGAFLFGYFILGKQNISNQPPGCPRQSINRAQRNKISGRAMLVFALAENLPAG
jgi:hypothetical protein